MGRKSRLKAHIRLDKHKSDIHSETLEPPGAPFPWPLLFWLSVITLIPLAQVTTFSFLNFDDSQYILKNPLVRTGLSGFSIQAAFLSSYAANWIPLTWITLMAEVNLWGFHAAGFHTTNLFLHILSASLLFLFLGKATKHYGRSFFVACFFAIHPMHVQSVAWITEIKDVLSTALAFTAILFYVRKPGRFNLGCFAFYLLSLLSKPMFVTMPFILLILDFWPLQRLNLSNSWKRVIEKIPYLIVAYFVSRLTLWAQTSAGAVQTFEDLSLPLRLQNSAAACVSYIGKLFLPARLSIFYPYAQHISPLSTISSCAILVAITVACVLLRRAKPYLIAGWLFFLVTLTPVIGIIQVGSQAMADRYTYVPYVGLFWMLSWLLFDFFQGKSRGKRNLLIAGILILLVLTQRTYVEAKYWKNGTALFQRAVDINPNISLTQYQLGVAFHDEMLYKEAKKHLQKARELNPKEREILNQLGLVFVKENNPAEAESLFKKAIEMDPAYFIAYNNLGALYWKRDPTLALKAFQRAAEINPDYDEANHNLLMLSLQRCSIQTVWPLIPQMTRLARTYTPIRKPLDFLIHLPGNTPLEKENSCVDSKFKRNSP